LKTYAPDGVDVFFDNVGGEILDHVLTRLARGAEAAAALAGWLPPEHLKSREHVVAGGHQALPEALVMLFEGRNTGKLVLAL
jgi:NADPH-dependent curcumin reductase CurA